MLTNNLSGVPASAHGSAQAGTLGALARAAGKIPQGKFQATGHLRHFSAEGLVSP
jgi:hypothetical protein